MLDIGWSELLLIGIVALIVVGPKELPGLFRTVGQFTGRARAMAREFQRSLEQAADQSGVNDAARSFKAATRFELDEAGSPSGARVSAAPRPDTAKGLKDDPGAPAPEAASPRPTGDAAGGAPPESS
jgi:sec-independent protein translocase protein TatB